MADQLFYIASIKHTASHDEHIDWWGKNHCGYTPVVGDSIGEYTLDEARKLNNGLDHLAVPVDAVKALCSPEPYYRPHKPARFYDQPGPVVDNTRANWNRLIAASLAEGRTTKPKPEVFKGARRSFDLAAWGVANG